jgi:NADPH-dependent curcumin reductase CurA
MDILFPPSIVLRKHEHDHVQVRDPGKPPSIFISPPLTETDNQTEQNWYQVSRRHLTVQGIVCYNGRMADPMTTFFPEVVPLVVAGTISRREDRYIGIARAAAALCDVHTGRNRAKAVVVIADE